MTEEKRLDGEQDTAALSESAAQEIAPQKKDTFSAKGIVSIILSLIGCCYFGVPSIVAIFLSASALKRDKKDVTAQIGLIASIIVTVFWIASGVLYLVDPELRQQLIDSIREAAEGYGLVSGGDFGEVLTNIIKR